jgi:hypothetical protein
LFKATSNKLSSSDSGVKIYMSGSCASLNLDLGDNDDIEIGDGKSACVFKIAETGFSRAQWVEMWTKNIAKEKKGAGKK